MAEKRELPELTNTEILHAFHKADPNRYMSTYIPDKYMVQLQAIARAQRELIQKYL